MKPKQRGFVSVILVALVCLVIAMPVQASVSYSQQCDTSWTTQNGDLDIEQKYDGNDWDPESNSSQSNGFWANNDDVNVSLEILLSHEEQMRQYPLDFEYWVMVDSWCPDNLQFKIIEGASSSTNQQYENIVEIDYQASDDRDLYVEIYNVGYGSAIQVAVTVLVHDGPEIIFWEVVFYDWQWII